ncbi:MAG: hypothetical protein WDN06_17365 [Asticcacaulis sp.]
MLREIQGLSTEELGRKDIRALIADANFFPRWAENLHQVEKRLFEILVQGRQIERSAIGFGFVWLDRRVKGRKYLYELQQASSKGDETALAQYLQQMLDSFAMKNLEFRMKLLDISDELNQAVRNGAIVRGRLDRVPLALRLTYSEEDQIRNISDQASHMISTALKHVEQNKKENYTFDPHFSRSNVQESGGYRLFAVYACIALKLGEWGLAMTCANQASERARAFKLTDLTVHDELRYLRAICIRFYLGMGPIFDAANSDLTYLRFVEAKELLKPLTAPETNDQFYYNARAKAEEAALILFASGWSLLRISDNNLVRPSHASIGDISHSGFAVEIYRDELPSGIRNLDRLVKDLNKRNVVTGEIALHLRQSRNKLPRTWPRRFCSYAWP